MVVQMGMTGKRVSTLGETAEGKDAGMVAGVEGAELIDKAVDLMLT